MSCNHPKHCIDKHHPYLFNIQYVQIYFSNQHSNIFLFSFLDAYENAQNLCDRYYMSSPEVVLEEFNGNFLLHTHSFT